MKNRVYIGLMDTKEKNRKQEVENVIVYADSMITD